MIPVLLPGGMDDRNGGIPVGAYHLSSALPQVNPLPNEARQTRSPSFILCCSQASHRAMGIDAAVVLPNRWMLLCTFSSLSFSECCTNLLIRRLAWWGISMSISEDFKPFWSRASIMASGILTTAFLK